MNAKEMKPIELLANYKKGLIKYLENKFPDYKKYNIITNFEEDENPVFITLFNEYKKTYKKLIDSNRKLDIPKKYRLNIKYIESGSIHQIHIIKTKLKQVKTVDINYLKNYSKTVNSKVNKQNIDSYLDFVSKKLGDNKLFSIKDYTRTHRMFYNETGQSQKVTSNSIIYIYKNEPKIILPITLNRFQSRIYKDSKTNKEYYYKPFITKENSFYINELSLYIMEKDKDEIERLKVEEFDNLEKLKSDLYNGIM